MLGRALVPSWRRAEAVSPSQRVTLLHPHGSDVRVVAVAHANGGPGPRRHPGAVVGARGGVRSRRSLVVHLSLGKETHSFSLTESHSSSVSCRAIGHPRDGAAGRVRCRVARPSASVGPQVLVQSRHVRRQHQHGRAGVRGARPSCWLRTHRLVRHRPRLPRGGHRLGGRGRASHLDHDCATARVAQPRGAGIAVHPDQRDHRHRDRALVSVRPEAALLAMVVVFAMLWAYGASDRERRKRDELALIHQATQARPHSWDPLPIVSLILRTAKELSGARVATLSLAVGAGQGPPATFRLDGDDQVRRLGDQESARSAMVGTSGPVAPGGRPPAGPLARARPRLSHGVSPGRRRGDGDAPRHEP